MSPKEFADYRHKGFLLRTNSAGWDKHGRPVWSLRGSSKLIERCLGSSYCKARASEKHRNPLVKSQQLNHKKSFVRQPSATTKRNVVSAGLNRCARPPQVNFAAREGKSAYPPITHTRPPSQTRKAMKSRPR